MRRKQNDAAAKPIPIYFVSSADGKTPVNSPNNRAVHLRKNGGVEVTSAAAIGTGTRGWHWWTPAATDLNTLGEVSVVAVGDGCDAFPFAFSVEPSTTEEDAGKIARIGTPAALVVAPVLDGGTIVVFIGDDNKAALANEVRINVETTINLLALGNVVSLGVGPRDGGAKFTLNGTATSTGANKWDFVFEPTKTHNGGLTPYADYGYTIQVTNAAGDERVLVDGIAKTRRKWT